MGQQTRFQLNVIDLRGKRLEKREPTAARITELWRERIDCRRNFSWLKC